MAPMLLEQRLAALERSILPVWVYDHHGHRFRWANARAIELWRAPDREELLSRDLSDLSPAVRTRLETYQLAVEQGREVEEDWTLYPRGVPTTTTLHGSGIQLDDGRLAVLFQALPRAPEVDATMVRGVEAVRHSSVLVSLLDADGWVLFHNPAALRAFGDVPRIDAHLADPAVAAAITAVLAAGAPYAAEVRVLTLQGERWHALEARPTRDPVTGAGAVLVQQLDTSALREARVRVEEQRGLIDDLNRSLALVESQRRQILALSAPILDVGSATLALPLIGQLDAERCREISERLLPAIGAQGADHVILDLTGIRGDLARELIAAGIELTDLLVLRSLRHGLEACRRGAARPASAVEIKIAGMQ